MLSKKSKDKYQLEYLELLPSHYNENSLHYNLIVMGGTILTN